MTTKITFAITIIISALACMPSYNSKVPCYFDKGIKSATTTAIIESDTTNKKFQIVDYDQMGRPVSREEGQNRITKFEYEGSNLKATLIYKTPSNNSFENFTFENLNSNLADKNLVLKNDKFGRPLIMQGADGKTLWFTYEGCEREFQTYKEEDGSIIFEYELIKSNGLPQKTIFIPHKDKEGTNTIIYFDYKFNEKGHWVERKFNYQKDKTIFEKRKLVYY